MNVKKRALRLSLNSSSSLVFTSRLFQVHKCEHSHNQSFIMYKFTFLDCVCVISVACDNVPTNKQTSLFPVWVFSMFGHIPYLLAFFAYLTDLFGFIVLSAVTFKALEAGACV